LGFGFLHQNLGFKQQMQGLNASTIDVFKGKKDGG
jgi:hypothetical protein